MAPIGTLWGNVKQPQTKMILTVAALNDFELDLPPISLQAKPAEFTDKFRYAKIPSYEGKDGFRLFEGTTIARYLSRIGTKASLLGSNDREAAIIDQWSHFSEQEIHIYTHIIKDLLDGTYPYNREVLDTVYKQLVRSFTFLESHLAQSSSGYVALNTLTLADFVVAGGIFFAARFALGSAERKQYPNIFAHYAKVTSDDRIKQYWGEDLFAEVRRTEPKA